MIQWTWGDVLKIPKMRQHCRREEKEEVPSNSHGQLLQYTAVKAHQLVMRYTSGPLNQ